MSKILLSAFEPFDKDSENASKVVLEALPNQLDGAQLVKVVLPVVFRHAFDQLKPLIEKHDPDYIVMMGEAKGATRISLEQIAINIMDAKTKDNHGNRMQGETIVEGGPDGLFTNLPIAELKQALLDQNIPVERSYSAGTFVCNALFYQTLYHVKSLNKTTGVGFVHVPAVPSQASRYRALPSMEKGLLAEAMLVYFDKLLSVPLEKRG